MIKRILPLFFIAALANSCTVAQIHTKYAGIINEETSRNHLTLLSSQEFEGRGTGQPGGMKTANYIADQFKAYGLKPIVDGSYFQPLELLRTSYKVEEFSIAGKKLVNGSNLFVQGDNAFSRFDAEEIIFIGYGIEDKKFNELDGISIRDKVVFLLNDGEPVDGQGQSAITGTTNKSIWSSNRFHRLQNVLKHRPKMVLVSGGDAEKIISQANDRNLMGRFTLDDGQSKAVGNPQAKAPIAFVDKSTADHILQKANTSIAQFKAAVNQTLMPASTNISISLRASVGVITERFNDPNVLGLIEGSDLKDEIVVVCGHYDHDGILPDGTFFPGADDNGSGTVAVLELARAFAKAKENGNGPRRSILFMGLAAEERGLLGSQYYTENPILPLENTVACINIDMIGRIDDLHLNGDHNYIHVIGVNKLSTDLKPIVEAANKDILINLDYSYDRPNEPMRLYYRSDHYNFAKNGIPALFFFSGLHPHYHTPEDTVDKIDFPMMVKREHLIFKTVWDIADRDERLKVDIPE
jgi:hypothetical protein